MVDDCGKFKIVKIINRNDDFFTDVNGNKYHNEKIKYIWKNKKPLKNPEYIRKHLLKEVN